MDRERAAAAVIWNGRIIMTHKTSSIWTLPGGGIESGETREEAAVRETKEEAGIDVEVVRLLFRRPYSAGTEYCFLAVPVNNSRLKISDGWAVDDAGVPREVMWKDIKEVSNDLQVAAVLEVLSAAEYREFGIEDLLV